MLKVNNNGNQATLTISGTNIQIPLGPTTSSSVQPQASTQISTGGTNQNASSSTQSNQNQQQQQQNPIFTIPTASGQTIQIPANAFSTASMCLFG